MSDTNIRQLIDEIPISGLQIRVVLGYLSDRFGVRPMIIWFFTGGVVFMVAFGFSPPEVGLLLVLAALIGFCVLGGFVGFYISAACLYRTEIRITGIGWSIGAGRTGAIIGPYLGGVLINMGYSTSVNINWKGYYALGDRI